jgi:LEA14-like dessication related protein
MVPVEINHLAIGPALAEPCGMRLVIFVCLVVLSGCSLFMRSIEKPSAKVRDVSVSSAGFTGVTGELRMDVTNPNPIGVPLQSIDWTLAIGGSKAVAGSVQLSQTIPAKGVAPVTTSLTIDARDAVAVASALSAGSRTYTLKATIRFSTAVGPLAVDIESSGELGGGGGLIDRATNILGAR